MIRELTREVPMAMLCATLWFGALAITGYPIEAWAGVAIAGYISLRITLPIATGVHFLILRWLLQNLQDSADAGHPHDHERTTLGVKAIAYLWVLSVLVGVGGGLSVILADRFVAVTTLQPLDPIISIVGLIAFGLGLLVNVAFYTMGINTIVSRRTHPINRSLPVQRQLFPWEPQWVSRIARASR